MRMMLKIVIPTETGNHAIKDGSLQKSFEAIMGKLKPEAAYFFPEHGLRSAMMIFDMKDASEIPAIAEPLFAGLNARIQLLPVMNADDLKKGLDIARQASIAVLPVVSLPSSTCSSPMPSMSPRPRGIPWSWPR